MQGDRLLAVDDTDPVDAGRRILHPEAGIGEHHRHGRQGGEAILVEKAQLRRVERIGAEPDAERVEDAILLAEDLADRRKAPVHQPIVVDRHFPSGSARVERGYASGRACAISRSLPRCTLVPLALAVVGKASSAKIRAGTLKRARPSPQNRRSAASSKAAPSRRVTKATGLNPSASATPTTWQPSMAAWRLICASISEGATR